MLRVWYLEKSKEMRFPPSVIPESIKNSSEKVLVKFACWGDADQSEKGTRT